MLFLSSSHKSDVETHRRIAADGRKNVPQKTDKQQISCFYFWLLKSQSRSFSARLTVKRGPLIGKGLARSLPVEILRY